MFPAPGDPLGAWEPCKAGGDSNSFPQGEMEGARPLQSAGSIWGAWLEAGGFAQPRCDCCWISKEEKPVLTRSWGWRDESGKACWPALGCSGCSVTGTQEQPARHVQAPVVGGSCISPGQGAESSPWLLASFPGSQDASWKACRLSGVPVLSLGRLLSPLPPAGAKPNITLSVWET